MRTGKCNVMSPYRSGSLMTVARESARYKLVFMGVQEVRCDTGGTVRERDYICFMEKETTIINWEQDLLYNRK